MCKLSGIALTVILLVTPASSRGNKFLDDICGHINGQRIYLDYGEVGTLEAKYHNNIMDKFIKSRPNSRRCSLEFISCPSCVVNVRFRFLNLSRNCDREPVFDSCGCDYVWIYEPTFEQSSEQFCGRFIASNFSSMNYKSQTRKLVVEFLYTGEYDHAFTLDYFSEGNKVISTGYPKSGNINNNSQYVATPFFPNYYPPDLTMEHKIKCESGNDTCRISLVFTDFLVAPSSIIDFFDWNSDRIYVTTGNIFRPPVIVTSGPSLTIRFYANGATDFGFRAYYSFILGQADTQLTPNIDCGGEVNNLGGGITMMNMVAEGLKAFDCVWLVKPPATHFHMKTNLYVKVVNFSGFAGSTELIIHEGLTSNGPIMENLKLSLVRLHHSKEKEHVVPITKGFYIRLKGLFRPESRLALVYAAFNYQNCLPGPDFLCYNKRCISWFLKCDGFDHCGDNSDELSLSCSKDPHDRREWSRTPNFLFPKDGGISQLATSTVVFLLSSFGLIGFIFAMVFLLYRINVKTHHQRQIQNHIETINAILEEGVGVVEEEIIIPDDPPDYEAPPDYDDVIKKLSTKTNKRVNSGQKKVSKLFHLEVNTVSVQSTSTPTIIPDSPPPAYDHERCLPDTAIDNNSGKQMCTIFNNLTTKNSLFSNASSLISKSRFSKFECFSDSELWRGCSRRSCYKIKKSFTADDVNSFI